MSKSKEMRPEYRREDLGTGVRGKYFERYMKPIQIGLIGFGTVGTGVVRLLTEQRELLARRLGSPLILKKVADLDLDAAAARGPAGGLSSPPGPKTSWTTRKSISWWNSSAAPLPPGTM